MPQIAPERNQLLLPYPHPGQQYVLTHRRRFNWLAAGRRWRKTSLCMAIAALAALESKRVLWGAPTYDQVRLGWNELKHGAARVASFNQSTMTVTFPGGGVINFRSLDDPDNARGHTADLIILDESADIAAEAWPEVLRPMLVDTGGELWAVGSPRGRNWFHVEWQAAQRRADSVAWQAPTLGVVVSGGRLERKPHPLENPNIPFAEIEELWQHTTERVFRQELLAEFVETSGGVFRDVAAVTRLQPRRPQPGHAHIFGVDFAESGDFSVIVGFDMSTQEQVFLDRFHEVAFDYQLERIGRWSDVYHPVAIYAESNSMGAPLVERLQTGYRRVDGSYRSALPVVRWVTTNASKRAIIEHLALAIESGTVTLLDDEQQTSELLAYEVNKLPSGLLRFGAPAGQFDDCVMALALAVAHGQPEQHATQRTSYRFEHTSLRT